MCFSTIGTVDIECGSTTNNAARQKDVAFAVTTYVEEVRIAVKASSGITSVAQLKDKSVATTTGTNNTSNANAKTVDPLFVGPLTCIAGFALDTSSPYATNAALERNYSDALDKIRVSNGGAMMLNSNATSAWTLVGSTP